MAWNPEQYARFREERAQPFHDLLALVRPRAGMRVVDLGCGPGELTRILHDRLGARETLGVDSSPERLAKAAAHGGGGLRFEPGDAGAWSDAGAWDLVFSNAALHWLPDHAALFSRLRAALAPAGQLAVQVPANFDHLSHTIAAEIAAEEPFSSAMDGYRRGRPILAPEEYALLLHELGFSEQQVRLQVYLHLLPSRDDVIEWVKGTLLTDYEARLSPDLFARFLDRYRGRLLAVLADLRPYPYPFKRLLLWASLG
jgi:trans-aconitate 2-methyltransferase